MIARVQNAISTRLGMFHIWKNKNEYSTMRLGEKFNINQTQSRVSFSSQRNVASKRGARAGIINGKTSVRFFSSRKDHSIRPEVAIDTSYFDIILQDTHWKKRWKMDKAATESYVAYKLLHYIYRWKYLRVIEKRLYGGVSRICRVEGCQVRVTLYSFSYIFSCAFFMSCFITRRLILRFGLNEVIKPFLKRHMNSAKAVIVGSYGRFSKRQRAFKGKFMFGGVPLNTFQAAIDYAKRFAKLKYGIGGIKVWMQGLLATKENFFKSYRYQKFYATLKKRIYKKFQFINRGEYKKDIRYLEFKKKILSKRVKLLNSLNDLKEIILDTKQKLTLENMYAIARTKVSDAAKLLSTTIKYCRNPLTGFLQTVDSLYRKNTLAGLLHPDYELSSRRSFYKKKIEKKLPKAPEYHDFIEMAREIMLKRKAKLNTVEEEMLNKKLQYKGKSQIIKIEEQPQIITKIKKSNKLWRFILQRHQANLLPLAYKIKLKNGFKKKVTFNEMLKNHLHKLLQKKCRIRKLKYQFNLSFIKKRRPRMFLKKRFQYRHRKWRLISKIFKYYRHPQITFFSKFRSYLHKKRVNFKKLKGYKNILKAKKRLSRNRNLKRYNNIFKINHHWDYNVSRKLYYQMILQRRYFKFLRKKKKVLKKLKKKGRKIKYILRYLQSYYTYKRSKRYPREYKFKASIFNPNNKYLFLKYQHTKKRPKKFKLSRKMRNLRKFRKSWKFRKSRRIRTLNLNGLLFHICPKLRYVPRARFKPRKKKKLKRPVKLPVIQKDTTIIPLKFINFVYKKFIKKSISKDYLSRKSSKSVISKDVYNRIKEKYKKKRPQKKMDKYDLLKKFIPRENKNKLLSTFSTAPTTRSESFLRNSGRRYYSTTSSTPTSKPRSFFPTSFRLFSPREILLFLPIIPGTILIGIQYLQNLEKHQNLIELRKLYETLMVEHIKLQEQVQELMLKRIEYREVPIGWNPTMVLGIGIVGTIIVLGIGIGWYIFYFNGTTEVLTEQLEALTDKVSAMQSIQNNQQLCLDHIVTNAFHIDKLSEIIRYHNLTIGKMRETLLSVYSDIRIPKVPGPDMLNHLPSQNAFGYFCIFMLYCAKPTATPTANTLKENKRFNPLGRSLSKQSTQPLKKASGRRYYSTQVPNPSKSKDTLFLFILGLLVIIIGCIITMVILFEKVITLEAQVITLTQLVQTLVESNLKLSATVVDLSNTVVDLKTLLERKFSPTAMTSPMPRIDLRKASTGIPLWIKIVFGIVCLTVLALAVQYAYSVTRPIEPHLTEEGEYFPDHILPDGSVSFKDLMAIADCDRQFPTIRTGSPVQTEQFPDTSHLSSSMRPISQNNYIPDTQAIIKGPDEILASYETLLDIDASEEVLYSDMDSQNSEIAEEFSPDSEVEEEVLDAEIVNSNPDGFLDEEEDDLLSNLVTILYSDIPPDDMFMPVVIFISVLKYTNKYYKFFHFYFIQVIKAK